jgi:hypothetical protein
MYVSYIAEGWPASENVLLAFCLTSLDVVRGVPHDLIVSDGIATIPLEVLGSNRSISVVSAVQYNELSWVSRSMSTCTVPSFRCFSFPCTTVSSGRTRYLVQVPGTRYLVQVKVQV